MSVKTRNQSQGKRIQQSSVITTRNGLPVDSYLTVEGTRPLHKGEAALLNYTSPTVTVPTNVDLEAVKVSSSKYTGKLVLVDSTGSLYFIDRHSIDNTTKTFNIYNEPDNLSSPNSISLDSGWVIAEANLVNKLATTSTAHIDEVEFNGFDVSFNLDGSADSVSIVDNGNKLKVNPDGSINVEGEIEADVIIDAEQGDTIAVRRNTNPFEHVTEFNRTAAQLDTTSYTTVFTYSNSLEQLRIKSVKVNANTFGIFQVKINGQLKDRFRTSPTDRNCQFFFTEEVDLPNGQDLIIEFKPERLRLSDYNFFTRLEGYQAID